MFPRFRHFRPLALLTPLVLLAAVGRADAGWMGFRNDTSATLVIQETGRHSAKPQKVFANETVRDTPPAGAQRTFTISDSAKPDKPLYTGRFAGPAAKRECPVRHQAGRQGRADRRGDHVGGRAWRKLHRRRR